MGYSPNIKSPSESKMLSEFKSRLCLIGLHRPVRKKVIWSGRHFSGECKHCKTPIIRYAPKIWISGR
jgi:hypothetical protein